MTLIYSAVSNNQAIQASDRRLTIIGSGQIYDGAANKTIVVHGATFTISASYTGVAYIKNLPTDDFLVRTLAGQSLKGSLSGFTFWKAPEDFHLHKVLQTWADALNQAFDASPALRKHLVEVHVAGLQHATPRQKQVLATVVRKGAAASKVTYEEEPKADRFKTFQIMAGGAVDERELADARAKLRDSGDTGENFSATLAQSVRHASRSSPVIGPDVMLVRILDRHTVLTEYLPDIGDAFSKPSKISDTYSPALVTPNILVSAAVSYASGGTNDTFIDGLRFIIRGPVTPARVTIEKDGTQLVTRASMSGQARKPAPH